jgi:ribonuclease P protein component
LRIAMVRLKQRADFLAAASGAKIATAAFVLQGRNRDDGGPARIGFTVSRKVGTAVERNRVRRRLRDVVRRSAADDLRSGFDYVLVGRRTALNRPFEQIIEDFRNALRRLERTRPSRPSSANGGGQTSKPRAGKPGR